MVSVMVVDTVRTLWFKIVGTVLALLLLSMLLVGTFGPATYEHSTISAYKCINDSHIWNDNSCIGQKLGDPGTFTLVWPETKFTTFNAFWNLVVFPFNKDYTINEEIIENLKLDISVFGKNDQLSDETFPIETNKVVTEDLLCSTGSQSCWGFVVAFEDTISYPYYYVNVSLPDTDNPAKQYVGDVVFQFSWYTDSFTQEQLTMRLIFLFTTTVLFFAFFFFLRTLPFEEWTIEQKWVIVLIISLVFFNNPFYPFEFLVGGWFFPTLDCFGQVVHISINLLFWLMIYDYYRRNEGMMTLKKEDIVKPVVLGIYGALSLALFLWFKLSHDFDPIFGDTQSSSGLVFLFFFCSLLFGAIIVWIIVIIMLAFPVVHKTPENAHRFYALTIPTIIVLISIVGSLFFGSFGPVRRNAPAFMYFFTLYNIYVWVIAFCFWPAKPNFSRASNPSEFSPIYKDEKPSDIFSGGAAEINDDDL